MDCKKENGVNWDEAISFVKANSNLQIWVKGRKFLLRTTLTLTLSIIFSFFLSFCPVPLYRYPFIAANKFTT